LGGCLNGSPVLWASKNPDSSEEGKTRAIPANHVYAVFEVKSAFNKDSILKSIGKLRDLNDFAEHLNRNFVSGTIFLEARVGEHASCKIAEYLYDNTISGYFGGLILRAEGLDQNITGYFQFITEGSDSVGTSEKMPLVRGIGTLQRNERGDPMLTDQGDVAMAYALGGKWHFDKGYSPNVKNVHLLWSYNAFARFAFDLLDRFEGAYTPLGKGTEVTTKQGSYGMSFSK
jgi:hypothetical protein